jgi:hypothetical protein
MVYTPISTPRGYTVFCDDIRQEANGKLIYIGVYTNGLVINVDFPVTIPKLALSITYIERPGESTDPVTFYVKCPWDKEGEPTASMKVPIEDFRKQPVSVELEDPQAAMEIHIMLSPFEIKSAGAMTVIAERGGKEYRVGRLALSKESKEDVDTPKRKRAPKKK